VRVPVERRWLFWDVDPGSIDPRRDAGFVIPRVLERGRLADVQWLMRVVGVARIHAFFRDEGSAELSRATVAFWRAYFEAEGETWAATQQFRGHSSLPWPG
jgi:uncharacterized protein DUF6922